MSGSANPTNVVEAKDLLEINSEHRLRSENLYVHHIKFLNPKAQPLHSLTEGNRPFDIDVWYPSLQQFTFPSKFIPLTRQEAQSIMNYQDTRYNERNKLTKSDIGVLDQLEARLDTALKSGFGSSGAFMRLCGRSPKDGEPLYRDRVYQKYETELQKLLNEGHPLNANTKLQAVSKVSWLGVSTGKEAMSLLLTSERVFADLHDWIKWGEPEQVVFRQWEPSLTLEYEFRAFVYRGKLNAIAQYDHYCIYPGLQQLVGKIQQRIIEHWEIIHPHVGVETYIMDFAYLVHSNDVIMIEISPFLNCTGPATFSWKNDRHILENGPFEFRLNTTPRDHLEELVEVNWDLRWSKQIPNYWDFYNRAIDDTLVARDSPSYTSLPFMLSVAASASAIYASHKFGGGYNSILLPLALTGSIYMMTYWTNNPSKPKPKTHLLFVYGTLKRNFHWNHKFLSLSSFVSEATTTEVYPLVVGGSGVPYLLGDLPGKGKHIKGEVWSIDDMTLQGLDEYEGISKGYYSRREITTKNREGKTIKANVYFKTESSTTLRELPFLEEYSLQYHKQNYKAIEHIMGCDFALEVYHIINVVYERHEA